MLSPTQVAAKVNGLEAHNSERDRRMDDIKQVRAGKLHDVFPELINDEETRSLVANFADVVARDLSEVIAPLPALNCQSGMITSDRARERAAKRQRIGQHYWIFSKLKLQMTTGADRFISYGFAPAIVEPDFDCKMPRIRFIDSWGSYPEWDNNDNVVSFTRKWRAKATALAVSYPHLSNDLMGNSRNALGQRTDRELTVYHYHDKDQNLIFIKELENLVLESYPNKMGKCLVRVGKRPSLDGECRGQFDDILGTQAARDKMVRLALEAAEKQVQAPIIAPSDVQEIPIGPDSILRTDSPQGVGRLNLGVNGNDLLESQALDQELRMGARYPEGRSGNINASIVTGRGVEALMGGFDTQVKTAQMVFGEMLRELTMLCYEMDEVYWGSSKKTIRGVAEGTLFEQDYTPKKDIGGDYTCDVTYGMLAGMDPNQGLVFMLQAKGAGLVDNGTIQRQMPWDIDVTQLQANIEVEKLREAGLAGVAALTQAIGPMIQQGGDGGQVLSALAQAIKMRQEGKQLEECLMAFAPPPPAQPPGAEGEPPDAGQAGPGGPGGPGPGGALPSGLLPGVAPGQAGMPPGGRPGLAQLMAAIAPNGQPRMQAGIKQQLPLQ